MALFLVEQAIDNDVWKLTFINDPAKLAEQDKNLMRMYGEPEIAVGGTFLDETADEFTLPEKYVKLRSGFPLTVEFDSKGAPFDTNTQVKVLGYRDAIMTRITEAFTALRANVDTFTATETYNI